jgi:hypothetical protein
MIKTVLLALLVSASTFAADAPQQNPQGQGRGQGPRGGGMSMMMDADKDGKVTKAEMNAWFDKVDVNKDGVLTAEELRAARPQGAGGPPADRGPRPQQPTK